MEDIALLPDLGISAGHVKSARSDAVLPAFFDKALQLTARVGRIGVGHGAATVLQRPLRRQKITPPQGCIGNEDFFERPEENVVNEGLLLAAEGLERRIVIVDLAAEVEGSVRIGVIKNPVGTDGVFAHIKGDMLVEWIRGPGIEPHRIRGSQAKRALIFVHVAGLVPEAVDLLVLLPRQIVTAPPPVLMAEIVGTVRAVCEKEPVALMVTDLEVPESYADAQIPRPESGRAIRLFIGRNRHPESFNR